MTKLVNLVMNKDIDDDNDDNDDDDDDDDHSEDGSGDDDDDDDDVKDNDGDDDDDDDDDKDAGKPLFDDEIETSKSQSSSSPPSSSSPSLLPIHEDACVHQALKNIIIFERNRDGAEDLSLCVDVDDEDIAKGSYFTRNFISSLCEETENDDSILPWVSANRSCFILTELLRVRLLL